MEELDCAGDVALLNSTHHDAKEKLHNFQQISIHIGLQINIPKTKKS